MIVVIGILFAVLISRVDFASDDAKATGAMTDLRSFQTAAHAIALKHNGFDSQEETLSDQLEVLSARLNEKLDAELQLSVSGDKLVSVTTDPWGTEYRVVYNKLSRANQVVVTSAAKDMTFDTNDDINVIIRFLIADDGVDIEVEHTTGKVELPEPYLIWGDVDGDGVVTEEDANLVLSYSSGAPTNINITVADVNGDGIITAIDSMLIGRFANNKICDFPVSGYSGVWGDANNDGEVTEEDVTLIMHYSVGKENSIYFKAADVSGDDKVNSTDARWVQWFLDGTISVFPVQRT